VLIKNNHFGCLSAKPYFENWFGGSMYYDLDSLQSATGKFQGTTQGDPMITSGGTGPNGYALKRGSPIIGAGMDYRALVPSPPTADYFGNSIPAGALNIGADAAAHR
jgi:hypothetical protein